MECQSKNSFPIMTLNKFLYSSDYSHANEEEEFAQLISGVQCVVKTISKELRRLGLPPLYGLKLSEGQGNKTISWLKKFANENFINTLIYSDSCSHILSKYNSDPIEVDPDHRGNYIVCVNPLHGEEEVHTSSPLISIFSVYRQGPKNYSKNSLLLPHKNYLFASGYALYANRTMIALTVGTKNGVQIFTLDTLLGEFTLTKTNLVLPTFGFHYCCNEGKEKYFSPGIRAFLSSEKNPERGLACSYRYSGNIARDLHRVLFYGGIVLSPATKDAPHGREKLLFTLKPLAHIIIETGGIATDGDMDILHLDLNSIHQRSPVFIGSIKNVNKLRSIVRKS